LITLGAGLGMAMCCWASLAQATVYGWKDANGVWNLSNDLESIPEAGLPSARKFTSKLARNSASSVTEPAPPLESVATPVNLQLNAYERGLEQGLQAADRQVALAGELARNILAAAPRTPPPRIIIQQPGPMIIREVLPEHYPAFFHGFIAPYVPSHWRLSYGYGYPYGFRRLVPHSHFFPGSRRGLRARRERIFFPQGHSSHHGFLAGYGFVIR
jgi:hypothetical protein